MAGFNFAPTGSGNSFTVLRPYLMGSYFIAPMGIFPSPQLKSVTRMTGPIKIGFLTPYSGVYPFYGHHLMAGILLGLYPGDCKPGRISVCAGLYPHGRP